LEFPQRGRLEEEQRRQRPQAAEMVGQRHHHLAEPLMSYRLVAVNGEGVRIGGGKRMRLEDAVALQDMKPRISLKDIHDGLDVLAAGANGIVEKLAHEYKHQEDQQRAHERREGHSLAKGGPNGGSGFGVRVSRRNILSPGFYAHADLLPALLFIHHFIPNATSG